MTRATCAAETAWSLSRARGGAPFARLTRVRVPIAGPRRVGVAREGVREGEGEATYDAAVAVAKEREEEGRSVLVVRLGAFWM